MSMPICIRKSDEEVLEPLLENKNAAAFLACAFVRIEKIFGNEVAARLEFFQYPDSKYFEYHVIIDPGDVNRLEADTLRDRLCEWWEPEVSRINFEIYPVLGVVDKE